MLILLGRNNAIYDKTKSLSLVNSPNKIVSDKRSSYLTVFRYIWQILHPVKHNRRIPSCSKQKVPRI
jgi:hypothetical protein